MGRMSVRVTVLYSKGSACCEGDFVVRRVPLKVTVL